MTTMDEERRALPVSVTNIRLCYFGGLGFVQSETSETKLKIRTIQYFPSSYSPPLPLCSLPSPKGSGRLYPTHPSPIRKVPRDNRPHKGIPHLSQQGFSTVTYQCLPICMILQEIVDICNESDQITLDTWRNSHNLVTHVENF